jgi:hypothetical protein
LPSPTELFNSDNPSEYIANRTRNRHVIEQEDLDRAAQYGI